MRHVCECGTRIYVHKAALMLAEGYADLRGHDLCSRCYRALTSHVAAQRMRPKPWWRVSDPWHLREMLNRR